MIANVAHNTGGTKGISKYVRYLLSPKKTEGIENSTDTARLVAFKCSDGRPAPTSKREIRAAVTSITEKIIEHNQQYKRGRKMKTDKHALMGEVSFSLKDKHLTPEDAMLIVEENLQNTMGGTREYVLACHADSDCLHVHFVVSTVDAETGKEYHPSNVKQADGKTYQRQMFDDWENEMERAEIAHGLERVHQRKGVARLEERQALAEGIKVKSTRHVEVKQPKHIAVSKRKRLGESDELTLHYKVQAIREQAQGDLDTFLDLLESNDITPSMQMGTTKINGITFLLNGTNEKVKGSDLGKSFAWPQLSKELNYDHDTHFARLQEFDQRHTRSQQGQDRATATSDTSQLGQVDEHTSTPADELGAIEHPTNGTNQRHEKTSVRGVETGGDGRIDQGNSNALGQLGTSHTGVDHSSQHTDGITPRLHPSGGSLEQPDEANQASTQGGDSRATQEPNTVELHSGGVIDNTDVLTGVSNPNMATEQGNTQGVVLSDDTPTQNPEQLSIVELIEQHQALADELVDLEGRIARGNLTDFWDEPPKTLGDRLAQVQAAYDANLAQIEAEPQGLINAPSTINNEWDMSNLGNEHDRRHQIGGMEL